MNKKSRAYWIKNGRPGYCPLCDAPLGSCNVGEYCSRTKCPYIDGIAVLTPKEATKFKDKILEPYRIPNL